MGPTPVQTADILKLNIDCLGEVFDYLPLKDLLSVGRTCKRLQQVVGHIYRQNYSGLDVNCSSRGIFVDRRFQIDYLAPFIEKMDIYYDGAFRYFLKVHTNLRRLKQLRIGHVKMNASDMRKIKEVLGRLEHLHLDDCNLKGSLHENMLVFCPKLKHLGVFSYPGPSAIVGNGNDWLLQKYTTLESFELTLGSFYRKRKFKIDELKTFLEQHSSIHTLTTTPHTLYDNRGSLLSANVQFNELIIRNHIGEHIDNIEMCMPFFTELHERGFYKRLAFLDVWRGGYEAIIEGMASLKAIVKVYALSEDKLNLRGFQNVEKLYCYSNDTIGDFKAMVTSLKKLQCIGFTVTNYYHVEFLISHAANIKKIVVYANIKDSDCVIDLVALNKRRAELTAPQKISLFVEENVYLATKWALNETNFEFIRLMRRDSYGG